MQKDEYKKMHELENYHWYFKFRKKLIGSFIDKICKNRKNLEILDAGCGTCMFTPILQKYGNVMGIEIYQDAIDICHKKGFNNVKKMSVNDMKFKDESFDFIACFDLLYHKNVKDDDLALKNLYKVCKKDGKLLLTDSASKILFGRHDLALGGKKRYNKNELKSKIEKAGFKVERISYYNFFLFPFVLIKRKLNIIFNKTPKSDIKKENFIINYTLEKITSFEAKLLNITNFPIGVSLVCIATKK